MIKKIDHIGIAVNNLEEAIKIWRDSLGLVFAGIEVVETQKVKTAFFPVGEAMIELLEPTDQDSPIASFLEKRGQGIHHIAFYTDDIKGDLKKLSDAGIVLIDNLPRRGAHGKLIAFLHPKSTGGILIELCQKPEE